MSWFIRSLLGSALLMSTRASSPMHTRSDIQFQALTLDDGLVVEDSSLNALQFRSGLSAGRRRHKKNKANLDLTLEQQTALLNNVRWIKENVTQIHWKLYWLMRDMKAHNSSLFGDDKRGTSMNSVNVNWLEHPITWYPGQRDVPEVVTSLPPRKPEPVKKSKSTKRRRSRAAKKTSVASSATDAEDTPSTKATAASEESDTVVAKTTTVEASTDDTMESPAVVSTPAKVSTDGTMKSPVVASTTVAATPADADKVSTSVATAAASIADIADATDSALSVSTTVAATTTAVAAAAVPTTDVATTTAVVGEVTSTAATAADSEATADAGFIESDVDVESLEEPSLGVSSSRTRRHHSRYSRMPPRARKVQMEMSKQQKRLDRAWKSMTNMERLMDFELNEITAHRAMGLAGVKASVGTASKSLLGMATSLESDLDRPHRKRKSEDDEPMMDPSKTAFEVIVEQVYIADNGTRNVWKHMQGDMEKFETVKRRVKEVLESEEEEEDDDDDWE